MSTTKATTLTTLAGLKRGFAFQTQANRTGAVLVVATDPPADFLSRKQHELLPLPIPEPKPGPQMDQGDRDMRYPGPSGSPTGSVGRSSGATACRVGRTADLRFASPTPVRVSDYPSRAADQGQPTQRATPSNRSWRQVAVRLSTAGK
jgi:hypothetical protein